MREDGRAAYPYSQNQGSIPTTPSAIRLAQLLNAHGENPRVVQEMLRHATLKVTTEPAASAVTE
jgi:hypothetical protein